MKNAAQAVRDPHQKECARIIDDLSGTHSRWAIWADFIEISAISIANITDKVHAEEREKTYMTIASKYSEKEMLKFGELLAEVVAGMDENPDQDFLGELFMGLELGNDHAGQFFTPYCVCQMMAAMTSGTKERIEANGWTGVSDPACGAGALLVAFANECRRQHINYQTSIMFVAQDIDYIVGMMCYLQLSLLGCPGYVVIGDSLVHPSVSYDKRGLLPKDDGNVWYTPMFFTQIWTGRRLWAQMDLLLRSTDKAIACGEAEDTQEPIPAAETPPDAPGDIETAPEAESPAEYAELAGGQLRLF